MREAPSQRRRRGLHRQNQERERIAWDLAILLLVSLGLLLDIFPWLPSLALVAAREGSRCPETVTQIEIVGEGWRVAPYVVGFVYLCGYVSGAGYADPRYVVVTERVNLTGPRIFLPLAWTGVW